MKLTNWSIMVVASAALAAGGGCSRTLEDPLSPSPPPGTTVANLLLTSAVFQQNGAIPPRYTCEGANVPPPLEWGEPPLGTKSFALVVDDPDAPKKRFVHWVVYDLRPDMRTMPEGIKSTPAGARDGKNDFGQPSYGGPCPPSGRHRYVFTVYALDVMLPDLGSPSAADLEKAMSGHVIARGQLVGTYEKGSAPPRT